MIESNIDCMIGDDRYEPCGVFCTLIGNDIPDRHETWMHHGVPVFAAACPWQDDMEVLFSRDDMTEPFSMFLDRVQPDLVHFHCIQRMGLELVDVVKSRGIPSVLTMHDGWWVADHLFIIDDDLRMACYDYQSTYPQDKHDRMTALKSAISKFDRVLTVSKKFADIIASTGLCREIGVNENGVSPLAVPAKSASDKVRILYMGGIDKRKGFHLLRAAVCKANIPNVHITVIDHRRREGFSRPGRWSCTDVNTVGYVSSEKVADLYKNTDIVIVPSLWPESFNLVSREASLAGCWVIASSLGAAGDHIVSGVNGYTFSPEKTDELVEILRDLNSHPEKFKTAPETVSLRSVNEQYLELRGTYDEVIKISTRSKTRPSPSS